MEVLLEKVFSIGYAPGYIMRTPGQLRGWSSRQLVESESVESDSNSISGNQEFQVQLDMSSSVSGE
jgi:hypothetical protein